MDNRAEILENVFKTAEISLSGAQIEAFLTYAALLEDWNSRMNLTAITDFREVCEKHFLDSVYPFAQGWVPVQGSLLDVGSGAGFPGIPLKIMFPELDICLMDALNKRILFLNEVISGLKLEQIRAVHGRAEDLAKNNAFRERFDLVTARAVASLSVLAEYCLPFAAPSGHFLAYKSGLIQEETQNAAQALHILGGELNEMLQYTLPGTDLNRSLLVIRKIQTTDKKYPRKAGTIRKNPL